ncbi:MAG: DNA polymerase III subunit epsilon [Novosphingobium sp.]|nr:MAG: DNA polymerase III subunit epsilon [Novosphingobium sp.]
MNSVNSVGRDIAADGEAVRLLYPLRLEEGPTGDAEDRGPYGGVAIDVETTGLDWRTGKVIELAARRFRYNRAGVITHIDRPYEWRQDPGESLSPEISRLTGLTDADLVGQEIDEIGAANVLSSTSFVVAHNSRFDRPWIEALLEGARGLRWACSMSEIDWRAEGFDGRTLGFLLMQAGFYHCGHRAGADVDALIQLLRRRFRDGRTALAHMIENAARPTWLFRARGADFSTKDALKARGYRWDAEGRVWWREVADADRHPEEWWLASHVYSDARAGALGPEVREVTARTRYLPLLDDASAAEPTI